MTIPTGCSATSPIGRSSMRPGWRGTGTTIRVLDSYGGLRINGKAQVLDTKGEIIPGLYAGGEASGGGWQHGIGRASVHGYIAGTNAVQERSA